MCVCVCVCVSVALTIALVNTLGHYIKARMEMCSDIGDAYTLTLSQRVTSDPTAVMVPQIEKITRPFLSIDISENIVKAVING